MFSTTAISSSIALNTAGLIALADLSTVADRTALTGSASFLDIFFLAPGMHRQHRASGVNSGEFPSTGAMTTGYVFRVENPATVSYLQRVGETGHLVIVHVRKNPLCDKRISRLSRLKYFFVAGGVTATIVYLLGPMLTMAVIALLGALHDWWGLGVLGMMILVRLINVVVIKRRSQKGWKGAKEEGVEGDLFVVLSQDRWVEMKGLVDDLKTVTSGRWLRDETKLEGFAIGFATLLIYGSAVLVGNASRIGSLLIACLMLVSAGLLGLCNSMTESLQMFDCVVSVEDRSSQYERRLDLVKKLINQSGRDDWAIGMGLIPKKDCSVAHLQDDPKVAAQNDPKVAHPQALPTQAVAGTDRWAIV